MVGNRVCVVALIFFASLISPMSFAKSVKLKTIKVTLDTDYGKLRAEIHFDERDLDVALKAEKIIQTDLIKVVNYFHHVPENTVHFNVDPYLRLTNGNATVFPTNTINLYKFPASNNEHLIVFDDWLRGLMFHEYIHVTHLDQTRGFLDVGKKIFGSVVKLAPSMVPHWFTEGIAVWGESHLMGPGGRLENPLFRKELLIQFMRTDSCKTIDCIDNPGIFPNGQMAYWAGSHFMEYLENKKAGTIRCLVEDNSNNIMFFLNTVFINCAGKDAQEMFTEFREDLLSREAILPEGNSWGEPVGNSFGSNDLQKGVVLDGNILFKLEKNREREALVSYDLQENVNMMTAQFNAPISDIVGITTMPVTDDEQTDHGKFLIVAFNEDFRFRENNRTWKLINTETLLEEATLPLQNDPSYVIGLGNNRFLTASFLNNRWKIERQRVDLANKTSATEVLYDFANEINITMFKKEGQKIFFKYNDANSGTTLAISDLTLEKFSKVYSSKVFFDEPLITENFLVIREGDKLKLAEFNDNGKGFSIGEIDKKLLNNVTTMELKEGRALTLDTSLKTKPMSPAESLKFFKTNAGKTSSENFASLTFPEAVMTNPSDTAMEDFPKLSHLRPYYWFLSGGTSDNLFSLNAFTTFSDPMDENVIEADVSLYPSESKVGGSVNAVHKLSSISDLWSINGIFNREFTKTDFNDSINEKTEGSVGTQYAILMKRWTLVPGLYVGTTKNTDFISSRTTNYYGSGSTLSYDALTFDEFFQTLILQLKLQDDGPDAGKSYLNLQTSLKIETRFSERFLAGVKASYGKLYKSGFTQGVLYGGGTSTIAGMRWHEFYGLPYGNAYGNELQTLRLYGDYNFWYAYRGAGLFPLYLREAHLLFGAEAMKADRIILDNRLYRYETIQSLFIGPRLKMTAVYFAPINLDIIFSSTKRPNGGQVTALESWISTSF